MFDLDRLGQAAEKNRQISRPCLFAVVRRKFVVMAVTELALPRPAAWLRALSETPFPVSLRALALPVCGQKCFRELAFPFSPACPYIRALVAVLWQHKTMADHHAT
jgi:hypothetical protein